MAVHLTPQALDWSLRHHRRYGDTDLFPPAFEFEVVEERWPELRKQLVALDLTRHEWRAGRSLLVMKDQVSFRRATQFDPVDSILFAALIWTVAPSIEARRPGRAQNVVFSYRFEPSSVGQLYASGKAKQAFWTYTVDAARKFSEPWLLTTDITDYYSQIRHTFLKAELDVTVTPEASDVLMSALRAVQGNSEIGVPVGPHSAHLLAELVLVPFDSYMLDAGHVHFRFVDDIHVACGSADAAQEALYDIADYMHRHLQLSLSRHKTEVLSGTGLIAHANTALGTGSDDSSDDAKRILIDGIVDEHTSANDDDEVEFEDLDEEARESLEAASLEEVLWELLDSPTQIKLRKYLRVLSHLHAPGAVDWVSQNLAEMLPALPQGIDYLLNTLPHYEGDRSHVLKLLLEGLELPIVAKSEHMQTLILAIFVRFWETVDFPKIAAYYKTVAPAAKREIVLLAGKRARVGWLKTLVARDDSSDPWLLRALIEASQCLGDAERRALKQRAKRLLGTTWLLEDPTHHVKKATALAHLAPEVLRSANTQDVKLTMSSVLDQHGLQNLVDRYGGTIQNVTKTVVTLSGMDVTKLLEDADKGRLEGSDGVPSVLEVVLADGECLYEELPVVASSIPASVDIDDKKLAKLLKRVDVLLVTSAEIERRAVLSRLMPLSGETSILVGSRKSVTYSIGQFGRYAAAHVHTTQGPDGPHGATLTINHALNGWNFKACFLIGIAFGFDRKTQRLGDVLIAETIQPYEHAKIEGPTQTYKPRGAAMTCGTVLFERFRNRMSGWARQRAVTPVALHRGTVLSGAKLVNSKPFRDQLYQRFKEQKPVGGEMEGHAGYAASEIEAVEVILVKGICDWADGDKNDAAQPFAMDVAVDACHYLLSKPNVLSGLKAKDLGLPPTVSTRLPDVTGVLAGFTGRRAKYSDLDEGNDPEASDTREDDDPLY